MSLRIRCPKCETDVREGTRRCPICATPLSVQAFEPREPEEGEPLLDPLLDLFERDEPVRTCPSCWNEFLTSLKRCSACARELRVVRRSQFEAALRFRPVFDRGTRVACGPIEYPRDLTRISLCSRPKEARQWEKEFRFMGLKLWIGSDTLDIDPDPARIGLYVRAADLAPARYLIEGERVIADDPFERKPRRDPREQILELAREYLELRKFKVVIVLLREMAGDPEADDLLGDALIHSGAVREAERRATAAMESLPKGPVRGRAAMAAGVFTALGNDGTPFAPGSRATVARDRLTIAIAEAPRLLDAGKAAVEVLYHLGDAPAALAELRRLARLNPNLLALDGWFRTTHEELRVKLLAS